MIRGEGRAPDFNKARAETLDSSTKNVSLDTSVPKGAQYIDLSKFPFSTFFQEMQAIHQKGEAEPLIESMLTLRNVVSQPSFDFPESFFSNSIFDIIISSADPSKEATLCATAFEVILAMTKNAPLPIDFQQSLQQLLLSSIHSRENEQISFECLRNCVVRSPIFRSHLLEQMDYPFLISLLSSRDASDGQMHSAFVFCVELIAPPMEAAIATQFASFLSSVENLNIDHISLLLSLLIHFKGTLDYFNTESLIKGLIRKLADSELKDQKTIIITLAEIINQCNEVSSADFFFAFDLLHSGDSKMVGCCLYLLACVIGRSKDLSIFYDNVSAISELYSQDASFSVKREVGRLVSSLITISSKTNVARFFEPKMIDILSNLTQIDDSSIQISAIRALRVLFEIGGSIGVAKLFEDGDTWPLIWELSESQNIEVANEATMLCHDFAPIAIDDEGFEGD